MEEIEVLEGGACMHAVMNTVSQLPGVCRLTLHRLPAPALAAVASLLLPAAASLTALSLDRGAVSSATVFDLARALAVNTTLRVLSVRRCALRAESLCELLEMLEENQTLVELDAAWSAHAGAKGRGREGEDGAGAWAALGALARNTTLEVLRLRGCALGDAAVAEVAAAVRENVRLRVLDVSCNPWTWRSAGALGEMLCGAPALERVEVEQCGLSRWGTWALLRACVGQPAPPVIDFRQVRRLSLRPYMRKEIRLVHPLLTVRWWTCTITWTTKCARLFVSVVDFQLRSPRRAPLQPPRKRAVLAWEDAAPSFAPVTLSRGVSCSGGKAE